jgi:hypothetical protein
LYVRTLIRRFQAVLWPFQNGYVYPLFFYVLYNVSRTSNVSKNYDFTTTIYVVTPMSHYAWLSFYKIYFLSKVAISKLDRAMPNDFWEWLVGKSHFGLKILESKLCLSQHNFMCVRAQLHVQYITYANFITSLGIPFLMFHALVFSFISLTMKQVIYT